MIKITHIIFDNNGVLTTNDKERTYERVSNFLGVPVSEVIKIFDKFVKNLDEGKITQKEFYSLVLKEGKFKFSVEDFAKVHLESYIPKNDVQEIAKKISKNYPTFLLSNFGKAFWDLYDKWGLNEIFSKENVFVSSDIGMAKPDKEIYEFVLNKLNLKAENVLFIDDNLDNIKSAKNLGLKVIHYVSFNSFVKDLKKFGVVTS